eukprot:5948311-Prymnesium_polylepis.1
MKREPIMFCRATSWSSRASMTRSGMRSVTTPVLLKGSYLPYEGGGWTPYEGGGCTPYEGGGCTRGSVHAGLLEAFVLELEAHPRGLITHH